MMHSRDCLIEQILDFMSVLYDCYSTTTFAEDRAIYAKDIATAMGWVVNIRSGQDMESAVKTILSPETNKYFGDYWRNGEWGERAAAALSALQEKLNNPQPSS